MNWLLKSRIKHSFALSEKLPFSEVLWRQHNWTYTKPHIHIYKYDFRFNYILDILILKGWSSNNLLKHNFAYTGNRVFSSNSFCCNKQTCFISLKITVNFSSALITLDLSFPKLWQFLRNCDRQKFFMQKQAADILGAARLCLRRTRCAFQSTSLIADVYGTW